MSTIKVDKNDFRELIEVAKGNPDPVSIKNLTTIRDKYNLRDFINNKKQILYGEVKKYEEGTPQNKTAHQKYKEFDDFCEGEKNNIGKVDYSNIRNAVENKYNSL